MSASSPTARAESSSRRGLRAIVVGILTTWSLVTTAPDVALPWHPLSSYGFLHKGGEISRVTAGSPAARAGIVVGDRIDLAAMSSNDRHHLYGAVYANSAEPGHPLTLPIVHDGQTRIVTIRSTVLERTPADNITDVILVLSQCAFVLIASGLVLLRPGVMTWAFYIYALANTGLSMLLNANLSVSWFVVQFGAASFLSGARAVAFSIFALRFPSDSVSGWRKRAEPLLIPLALILGGLGLYAGVAPTVWGHVTGGFDAFVAIADFGAYALGAFAFITNYARATSSDRQRIKWVLAGLVAGFGGSAGFDLIRWLIPSAVSIPLYNSMYSLNVLLPIALAYAIIRHRVIDVNFIISRALVYATLTAAVVAIFASIDWLFGSYLSASLGPTAEIIAAIGLGFWLNALHERVNHFVNSLIFRRRHEAKNRFARLGRALPHVGTLKAIAEALVDQTAEIMELGSAALFMRTETAFERVRAAGWSADDLTDVQLGALMVAQLAAENRPVKVRDLGWHAKGLPEGAAAPTLALPILVRRELRAFALYGGPSRGEAFDPDEIAVVGELAAGASAAFDHIEAEALRQQAQSAQARLEALGLAVHTDVPVGLEPAPQPERIHAASVAPRKSGRAAFVAAVFACCITALTIISCVPDLLRPFFPAGVGGVTIDNDDFVTSVDPGGPAARAGLAVGDRLDTSDFQTRIIWGWGSAQHSSSPNERIPVKYIHKGERRTTTLITQAERRSVADTATIFLGSIAGIFMVLTSLGLVLLRPTLMTWGFFVYALALNPASTQRFVAWLSPEAIIAYTGWVLLLFFAGNIGLTVFALRFPRNTLSRTGRVLQIVLTCVFIPAGAVYAYYVVVFPLYGITGGRAFSLLTDFMTVFAYAIAMIGFLETFAHASSEDRQRMKWVIGGLAVGVAGLITSFVLSDVSLSALAIPAWIVGCAESVAVVIPITVVYAVIHERVIDVQFAVNRAVVLGVWTAGMIGVFSLLDWFFGKELSASRLGAVAEIVVAIGLGFWLNGLHGRASRLVDAVLFGRRHLAEERLRRIRDGLQHASTASAVYDAVVREAVDALGLASAAVFVRTDSGGYFRRTDQGWNDGTSRGLETDDPILLQLKGAAKPLRLRNVGTSSAVLPEGHARPVVAIPMLLRNQLVGAVFYGPHASGADLDVDELETLDMLVQAAASANDHIEAEALRSRVRELSMALSTAGLTL